MSMRRCVRRRLAARAARPAAAGCTTAHGAGRSAPVLAPSAEPCSPGAAAAAWASADVDAVGDATAASCDELQKAMEKLKGGGGVGTSFMSDASSLDIPTLGDAPAS